jgi:hypothetical protein
MSISAIAAGSLVLSLLSGTPAPSAAADPPPPGQITIDKLKANGSGCRPQTIATAISPDKQAFTITYSEYLASVGPGIKSKEAHKDCGITIRLNVPAGYTYAIAHADYRGFAVLQPGVTGSHSAAYSFQASGHTPTVTTWSRTGPWDNDLQLSDTPAAPLYGPCGKERKLDINTNLDLTASGTQTDVSVVGIDSADGEFTSTYKLAWKRC